MIVATEMRVAMVRQKVTAICAPVLRSWKLQTVGQTLGCSALANAQQTATVLKGQLGKMQPLLKTSAIHAACNAKVDALDQRATIVLARPRNVATCITMVLALRIVLFTDVDTR